PPSRSWWYSRQNFLLFGWIPDYPDAYNYFPPYLSTDPWIDQQLEQAAIEFNDTARAAIYSEIQRYINEGFFPVIYLYHNAVSYIHNKHLKSVPYTPTALFYAYPIEFEK
ncbi:MAG: hypothetical protein ACFFDX_02225, partial [Candidatus Odinarchaeota archaeon]